MSHVFKLSEWNDLIDEVNEKREECHLSPIDPYENDKPFAKSEVRRVRDAVPGECDVDWRELETPEPIHHKLIDEILEELEKCECCCERDEEGFGSFEVIQTMQFVIVEESKPGDLGLPAWLFLLNPLATVHDGTPGESYAIPPPPNSRSFVWELRLVLFRDNEPFKAAGILRSSTCGVPHGGPITQFIPTRMIAFEGADIGRYYVEFQLSHSGSLDICGDCTDDPKPNCGEE